MSDEVTSDDILGTIVICAATAAIVVGGIILFALAASLYAIMTSWLIFPFTGIVILATFFLNQAYNERQTTKRYQQSLDNARQKQEQRRLAAEQQQQRQIDYNNAYATFAFVLKRNPAEARIQLERLADQYPDLLRNDARLAGDFEKLLKTESGQFEERLKRKLGL